MKGQTARVVVIAVLMMLMAGAAMASPLEVGVKAYYPNDGNLGLSNGNNVTIAHEGGKILGMKMVTSIDIIGGMNKSESWSQRCSDIDASIHANSQILSIGPRIKSGKATLQLAVGVGRTNEKLSVNITRHERTKNFSESDTTWRLAKKLVGEYNFSKRLSASLGYTWTGVHETSGPSIGLTYKIR